MFSPIPDILDDLRAGKMIVLVDDERRENEGDLVLAAQHATPEAINFMTRFAGGYLCLSLTASDCDRLALTPQAADNTSVRGTAFTVSIDGHPRHGVGTGVSASDRARTVKLAIDPSTGPGDFVRPGHINPLRARDGGVLVRTGQTEGAVDLARLAGLHPSALIIEIVREDGEMARRDDLERLCAKNGLKMCSVDQVIAHRLARESLVRRLEPRAGTPIDTEFGRFNLIAYESVVDPAPHLALTLGGVGDLDASGSARAQPGDTLVRMHRRDLLGDLFGRVEGGEASTGAQLRAAMAAIRKEGRGAVVYLRPRGVGDDPEQHLAALRGPSALAEDRPDLANMRRDRDAGGVVRRLDYGIGSQILRDLGVTRLRLLTNHPRGVPGLEAFGLTITGHVALTPARVY
ncbi:MAG: 3,4-dihydroxy-2-butanone-4-phosphate synthase [Phycisphaerales bacterium]|nr:3,4-dihydroxy-2-butanone-4-phosphate synthase [Phycisphaerales bacterium]